MYRFYRFAILLFAAIMMLVGSSMLFGKLSRFNKTKDWPSATCEIASLELFPASRQEVMCTIEFKFEVDGRKYVGTQVSQDNPAGFFTRSEGKEVRAKYPIGSSATVTYSPEQPRSKSFLEPIGWSDILILPIAFFLLGAWLIYVLRKTRVRIVPKRVMQNQEDPNSARWLAICQSVLQQDQIQVRGTAWYARSPGISQWPKSRVGLVATPNTIGVVRGSFTVAGAMAALATTILEIPLNVYLALFHAISFLGEWLSRISTWKFFASGKDPNEYSTVKNSADIVSIDATILYGYDPKKHELWFRLPSRPVDDCIKLAPDLIDEVEQFIAFVRLMQQSNKISLDDHIIVNEP